MTEPKFPIGTYVRWYNDIIDGKEVLSEPYMVTNVQFQFNEWLYTITYKDEIDYIFESGLYPTKNEMRRIKLERILKMVLSENRTP